MRPVSRETKKKTDAAGSAFPDIGVHEGAPRQRLCPLVSWKLDQPLHHLHGDEITGRDARASVLEHDEAIGLGHGTQYP
jgi:hypothetical protein